MKERLTILMVVALAVGVLAPSAHAALTLNLTDGIANVTIVDGGVGDGSALAGMVSYNGPVGLNWNANVTTGTGKPLLGIPGQEAHLDLNTVDVTSLGAGTLTILLSDIDFVLSPEVGAQAVVQSNVGGTTNGTVTFEQILDRENVLFGTGSADFVSLAQGPFGPGAFSASASAGAADSFTFSLTEKAVITHSAREQITSFNAESTVVPVPGAILLGLLGLGAAGLKLRRFA